MDIGCSCFSCSQYRNLDKIDFLKRSKSATIGGLMNSHIPNLSNGPISRLPDDVLFRIFNCIPPTNMDNFLTLIALEMVSKRIRNYMLKNSRIWENATELVLGFHPDLAEDQYLCHIGYLTLQLFLRRVDKITKIIINLQSHKFHCDWSCTVMMSAKIYPLLGKYTSKIELQELNLYKYRNCGEEDEIVKKLLNKETKKSLKSLHVSNHGVEYFYAKFCPLFADCTSLKNLKISDNDDDYCPSIDGFFDQFKMLEVLEISDYTHEWLGTVIRLFENVKTLNTLRFTNPNNNGPGYTLPYYLWFLKNAHRPLHELEIHICFHGKDFDMHFSDATKLNHLKMTFLPCLDINKLAKVTEFLQNARWRNMKISFTFKHTDMDRKDKLLFVHTLLDSFGMPHIPKRENKWEFIREKLYVNLKLEKFQM